MIAKISFNDLEIVIRDTGKTLMYSSVLFLIPFIFSIANIESIENILSFALSAILIFFFGFILTSITTTKQETELKHALLSVALIWLFFSLFSALPFTLILGVPLIDAFFETMSALTTTGLSVMIQLVDSMPASLIFWRSILSWLGGLGIIVMAAIGIFSSYTKTSKLLIAEGREDRLKPNLKNSIKELWTIYGGLTVFGVIILFLSGMNLWFAVNYSMTAISTTGMDITSKGLSVENFQWQPIGIHNYWVDISLIIIMILGATSFLVHFKFFKRKDEKAYFKDIEFKAMIVIGLITVIPLILKLGIESSFFYAFSALTAGGISLHLPSTLFQWDDFTKLILAIIMIIGGSSGSTAGGIKISRLILFLKGIKWKINEIILPKDAVFPKKFEGNPIKENLVSQVNFFVLSYALFILIGTIVLTFYGFSLSDSLFEVSSAQGNAGLSVGITSYLMPLTAKIMLLINMFVGRLEIIPFFSIIGYALSLTQKG